MTNDAKLGILAGVAGVVMAAALGTNPSPLEPPSASDSATTRSPVVAQPQPQPWADAVAGRPVASNPAPVRGSEPPLPPSPVVRTRPEVPAWPASRPTSGEEEP